MGTARMATADYGNQNINCQLVLAVGSQAIQRFNFISTNFQPSTGFVTTFNLQLVL